MYIYASLFCIYQKKYVFLTETRTFNFHDPLFSFFHLYKKTAVSTSAAPCPAAGPLIPGRKSDEP